MSSSEAYEPFLSPLDGVEEKLRAVLEPAIEGQGLELVQLHLVRGGHRDVLRLFVDKKGAGIAPGKGVSMDELERLNRMLGDLLDVEDDGGRIFGDAYELEVGSPGVDRPLTRRSHFGDVIGARVKLKTRLPVEGRRALDGRIGGTSDDGVSLLEITSAPVVVPWAAIQTAHVVFEFAAPSRPKARPAQANKTAAVVAARDKKHKKGPGRAAAKKGRTQDPAPDDDSAS